jgi:hypothetical protein
VSFLPNGAIGIEYVNTADCKENGMQKDNTLFIPAGKDYDDEIEAIRDAVSAALEDALEDFDGLPVYDPKKYVDDDDDEDEDEDVVDGV